MTNVQVAMICALLMVLAHGVQAISDLLSATSWTRRGWEVLQLSAVTNAAYYLVQTLL